MTTAADVLPVSTTPTTPTEGTPPVAVATPAVTPPVSGTPTGETPTGDAPAVTPAEAPKTPRAPERYEFTTPEGLPSDFVRDEQVFDALANVARDLDLSQEDAQLLVNKVWPTMHRRQEERTNAQHQAWQDELRADPEFGGDKFDENTGIALRAVEAYGDDDLKQDMKGPLGSYPPLMRFLRKAGSFLTEDKFVSGKPSGGQLDLNDDAAVAKVMYPEHN